MVRSDKGSEDGYRGSPVTRQRIIEAGFETVRRFGIRRTTMDDVARRAGVSRAAVYRYFPDKQGLVDAVLLHNGHLVRDELSRRLKDTVSFADKCVVAAQLPLPGAHIFLALNETEPEALALLLTTGALPFMERATRFWEVHIREAQAAGEVRKDLDARRTAEWVARSLFNLSTVPTVTFDRQDPAELEAFVRTYIAGALTPPSRRRSTG